MQAGEVETPAMAAEAGRGTRRGAESDEESDGCNGAQDSARTSTQHILSRKALSVAPRSQLPVKFFNCEDAFEPSRALTLLPPRWPSCSHPGSTYAQRIILCVKFYQIAWRTACLALSPTEWLFWTPSPNEQLSSISRPPNPSLACSRALRSITSSSREAALRACCALLSINSSSSSLSL